VGNFFGGVRTVESDKKIYRSSSPFPAHATLPSPVSYMNSGRDRENGGTKGDQGFIQDFF